MPYVCALGPLLAPIYNDASGATWRTISPSQKEHITISYRTEPFDDTTPLELWPDNIAVKVLGQALFGENNDIPVYEVCFVDDDLNTMLHRFHDRTELRSPNEYSPPHYRPHITAKHLTERLETGTLLWVSRIFVKKVGSDEPPVYERQLNPTMMG